MTEFADPDIDAPARERQERNADLPGFFKMKDLVGRHVIINPVKIETETGKYGDYDKVTANPVIVLDGRKSELFPEFPRIQAGNGTWIFDGDIVAELRKCFDPKHEDYGKKVLAYVNVMDQNGKTKLILESPEPEARAKAQAAWEQYESGSTLGQDGQPSEEPPF